MAVAFDAQSFKDFTGTGGTWTHVPVGVPRGIWVGVVQSGLSTNQVTSVNFGGATLTAIGGFGQDTATEPATAQAFFKGSAVAASGTVNIVSVAGTFTAWAVTVTANQAWTEVVTSGTRGEDQSNPSLTLASGAADSGMAFSVLFSGLAAPGAGTIDGGAGYTKLLGSASGGRDFGSNSGAAEYGLKAGANVVVNWVSASDDCAMHAMMIREIPPGTSSFPLVNFALGW